MTDPGARSTPSLDVPLDRTSPVPLYFQVAQHLEQLIVAGQLTPGTRLDNEIALAGRLGLSRPTMRRAIQYLVDRGLLVRRRGVGTTVVRSRVRRPVELSSLYDDLIKAGQQPRTEVLGLDVEPATDLIAHALSVPEASEVYHLRRLRYADDEPLAVLRNYLPTSRLRLDAGALAEHGLYQLLRRAGVQPKVATQTIGARAATAGEAGMLGERKGAPLLTMTRTAYDDAGTAVEYGNHVYRASVYSFEITLMTS